MNPFTMFINWIRDMLFNAKQNTSYKKYLLNGLSLKDLNTVCIYFGLNVNNVNHDRNTNQTVTTPKNYIQLQRLIMFKLNRDNIYTAITNSKIKSKVKTYEAWCNGR